jgi:hypothetical protein
MDLNCFFILILQDNIKKDAFPKEGVICDSLLFSNSANATSRSFRGMVDYGADVALRLAAK